MSYYSNYSSSPFSYYWTKGVKFLIITNLIAFGLQIIASLIPGMRYNIMNVYLGLHPIDVFEKFWLWQLVTCAFLHDVNSIFHIFFNLLTLYFFGNVVERHYGTKRFLQFYFLCAIFSSLSFCTTQYFLSSPWGYAIGASGAIMGVLVISACLLPNAVVYIYFLFPVKLSKLVWFLIAIDLYIVLMPYGGIAATGHLGGALFGYLYYRLSNPIYQFISSKFTNWKQNLQEEYKREQFEKYSKIRMKTDWLLEKIHKEGLSSLTEEERIFLKKASQNYREELNDDE